jgi:hypothetical protein
MILFMSTTEPIKAFTVRLPYSLWERSKSAAEKLGVPHNTFITDALSKEMPNAAQPDPSGTDAKTGVRRGVLGSGPKAAE